MTMGLFVTTVFAFGFSLDAFEDPSPNGSEENVSFGK